MKGQFAGDCFRCVSSTFRSHSIANTFGIDLDKYVLRKRFEGLLQRNGRAERVFVTHGKTKIGAETQQSETLDEDAAAGLER